ncbi:NAD(P)-binding protein [Aureobasidium sp. EXF-12298]|nr:NAD(P)-binding protein [Aureobasidium sp. EXF-12298]
MSSNAILEGDESQHFSPYRADGKLYGFVCIVTGATQAIGKAIVHELAAHGAACIYACSDLSSGPDDSLAAEVNALWPNTKVIGYPYGLKEEDTLTLIDDVLNSWGRLDVYITSSGLLGPASITQTAPQDLYKTFETNSMAPFFALKYAPPAMAKTTPKGNYANAAPKDVAYGSIIVVSSVASTYGGCWGPAFTMSSHAALGVVHAGVAVLKGSNVRINAISPGQIDVGINIVENPSFYSMILLLLTNYDLQNFYKAFATVSQANRLSNNRIAKTDKVQRASQPLSHHDRAEQEPETTRQYDGGGEWF